MGSQYQKKFLLKINVVEWRKPFGQALTKKYVLGWLGDHFIFCCSSSLEIHTLMATLDFCCQIFVDVLLNQLVIVAEAVGLLLHG